MKRRKQKRPLLDVLIEQKGNMTPEELFHAAGFNDTDVDEFFQELKREEASGRIRQLRPDNTAVILIAQAE